MGWNKSALERLLQSKADKQELKRKEKIRKEPKEYGYNNLWYEMNKAINSATGDTSKIKFRPRQSGVRGMQYILDEFSNLQYPAAFPGAIYHWGTGTIRPDIIREYSQEPEEPVKITPQELTDTKGKKWGIDGTNPTNS